ncbi:MAG: glycosyltransferase [Anaerohalosphaeraceae bacterium]|nr:glycosyltransferase [Anaerohalosphaeraceae bacterium]
MTTTTIKRLGIITSGYPSVANPANYTFVRQLAYAVARAGVSCTVFSPVNFRHSLNRKGYAYHSVEPAGEGKDVHVFRPRFIQYWGRGGMAKLGVLNPQRAMLHSFTKSVIRTIRREKLELDAVYGHFFYSGGVAAIRVGRKFGISAFPGMGESTSGGDKIWSIEPYGTVYAKREAEYAKGIITNSSLLADMIRRILDYPSEKIGVFPNGTNLKLFCPSDKIASRKELSFPEEDMIVACIGHYSNRKGHQRVMDAIGPLDGVKVVFAGKGMPFQKDNKVLWNTTVSQEKIPGLLSACDLFVLPTLREGSCNAIVEAMACGLPVISSDGAFNDDLLTNDMSIRINPRSVEEIRNAIITLRDNPVRRKQMAEAAIKRAKQFDVNDRAKRILNFMENLSS